MGLYKWLMYLNWMGYITIYIYRHKIYSILGYNYIESFMSAAFWYYCFRLCCNILDSGFYALRVVLLWEYKVSTIISDLHNVIVNHWTLDGATTWYVLHICPVVNDWIPVKIFWIYGEWVQIIHLSRCTNITLMNLTVINV